jgi:SAM-dependent methyltransferase
VNSDQRQRWSTVLGHLTKAIPPGTPSVVVDGSGDRAALLADRLAAAFRDQGRPCVRLTDAVYPADWDADGDAADAVVIADGPRWRAHVPAGGWRLTIWIRSAPQAVDGFGGDGADIVVDLQDPAWPVIRQLGRFAGNDVLYRSETRAFFAAKAATWDAKFGDDLPAYTEAISEAALPAGGTVVDVGCGTGRALPPLRQAVGPQGIVIGIDLTPQMLAVARVRAEASGAALLAADARHLPFPDAAVDAVFAAGLLMHLPDADAGLRELARVTRPGGKLVLFHPTGRCVLAARHGRTLRPDDPMAETPLRLAAHRTGWQLSTYDDPPHRFLAIATRASLSA